MTIRKTSHIVLALVLVFATMLPLCAGAKNGPMPPDEESGRSLAYINFVPLDENGKTILDEEGFGSVRHVYYEEKTYDEQPGAVYDITTNTLTLTDLDGDNIGLGVNAMGDDFKLEIVGNCSLAWIWLYGWGHGGSLYVTGDGTLTVNKKLYDECGLVMIPEGVDATLSFGKNVNADIYGTTNAIEVRASSEYDKGCTMTFDLGTGASAQPVKTPAVRQQYVRVGGYTMTEDTIRDMWLDLGTSKNDPDGVYRIYYTHVLPPEGEDYDEWIVQRYIYIPENDLYLEDYEYNYANKTSEYDIAYSTFEELQAAGYDLKLDENGEQEQILVKTIWDYSNFFAVLVDNAGNEYAEISVFSGEGDDITLTDVAADMIPIPGSDDYILIPRYDINIDDLLEKSVTVVLEDTYDYYLGGTEFHYIGSPKDPVPVEPTTSAPETTTLAPVPTTSEPTTSTPAPTETTTSVPVPAEPTTTVPVPVEPTTVSPAEPTTNSQEPSTTDVNKEVSLGDVNLDGKVDAFDARLALRAAAKLDTLEGVKFTNADVDGNGIINAIDARTILRVAAKLESFT